MIIIQMSVCADLSLSIVGPIMTSKMDGWSMERTTVHNCSQHANDFFLLIIK